MRTIVNFPCGTDSLSGAFDAADGTTGLLILSGGMKSAAELMQGKLLSRSIFRRLVIPCSALTGAV